MSYLITLLKLYLVINVVSTKDLFVKIFSFLIFENNMHTTMSHLAVTLICLSTFLQIEETKSIREESIEHDYKRRTVFLVHC